MSLAIDTNVEFLQRYLRLSDDKLKSYQNMSAEEILKAEASSGNQLAIQLAQEIMTNPDFLIEIFKLANPENKIMILRNMSDHQLSELLRKMEHEDLIQGLMFFKEEKLMSLLQDIPPDQLVKTALQMFTPEMLIKLMPPQQLDKLLTDDSMDKDKMLKQLQALPIEFLAQALETTSGKSFEGNNSAEIIKEVGNLGTNDYKDFLKHLQPTAKQMLVTGLVKQDPKLMEKFDPVAYTNIFAQQKNKAEIIQAMAVIENDQLVKMLQQLPQDLTRIVISQMDTQEFAKNLIEKTPEILAELIRG